MGLYHFSWEGKERTVSIDKHYKDQVKVQFLDKDIREQATEKLTLIAGQPIAAALHHFDDPRKEKISAILKTLEEKIGPIFQASGSTL